MTPIDLTIYCIALTMHALEQTNRANDAAEDMLKTARESNRLLREKIAEHGKLIQIAKRQQAIIAKLEEENAKLRECRS